MSIDKVVKQAVDNAYEMGKRDGREEADKIIALLRAEVKTWREGCSWRFAFRHDMENPIKESMRDVDAAGALEDK